MQARLTSDFGKVPPIEAWLPRIEMPMAPRVTHYEDGRMMLAMRLTGIPFESASDALLTSLFDNLSAFYAGIGRDYGNRLSMWATFKRRKVTFKQQYEFQTRFLQDFTGKYLQRFHNGNYFENSFYLSLLLKYDDFDDGLKAIEQLGDEAVKSLRDYDPEYLETYQRNGLPFSEPYRFVGELVNGTDLAVPVTAAPGYEDIPDSWLHFGYDLLVIRTDAAEKYATCYDLKDFPKSGWGQLNPLLTLDAEFTITQSFGCLTAAAAEKAIDSQINKLESVGDKAHHQIAELQHAQGLVRAGELAFGQYHGALVVYGDTAKEAIDRGELVKVRSKGECGVGWVRATASAPYTYFSQVPGAKILPRPMLKSSRNLGSTFSLHDYSAGKSKGNPIGDGTAVMPLQTVSKKLYSFNYHATREDEINVGEKIAGHTVIHGATGAGKTALQLAIASFFMRFDPMLFGLDYGGGMKIFFKMLRGTYISLQRGVATGLAPFELPDTQYNRQFLYDLVNICGRDADGKLTAEEKTQIKGAVDTVMALEELSQRTFSRLLESIPNLGGDSLYVRLGQWCHAEDGPLAWMFDNPPRSLVDVTDQRHVCFDVTEFLVDDYAPSEPLFAYLFHLKALMQLDGGLMMSIIEEYWAPIKFKRTREEMAKVLSAGRKEGEFLVLVSQQPEQGMASEIWPQIRSQTATKIFLPDPEAEYSSYQRTNMTPKEFAEFKRLSKNSRTCLIKQSNQSAFATLDLYGFQDEMVVLSGNKENNKLLDEVIAEVGDDPDVWLPILQDRVFEANTRKKLMAECGNDASIWGPKLATAMQARRASRPSANESMHRQLA
ncbi:Type IV secretion system protein virB4 [Ralstonia psammae]|uniref:Type IV secretion system protein virB4 n=1 Tax=Ralstonia psammae TaxID=3058598 RepID=A0ABM9JXM0_9RALS|nr:transporter [Ralstonia sp. LMG 19083]CAJ0807720.1 Type IV secretion system protein virB4 [Ralstonia sp. LMG 19083]